MDSIYQETGILVTKKRSVLELGAEEGEFEVRMQMRFGWVA
jgi:hypothetical protein